MLAKRIMSKIMSLQGPSNDHGFAQVLTSSEALKNALRMRAEHRFIGDTQAERSRAGDVWLMHGVAVREAQEQYAKAVEQWQVRKFGN
jgi:hypothetical protein